MPTSLCAPLVLLSQLAQIHLYLYRARRQEWVQVGAAAQHECLDRQGAVCWWPSLLGLGVMFQEGGCTQYVSPAPAASSACCT